MPRIPRQQSETGVYHVFLRGVDRQTIFKDFEDFSAFKDFTTKSKEKSNFLLYGFCLMDNHIHLLLKTGEEDIGTTVQRAATGYAGWFNRKHGRVGHLFQARFGSEPIATDEYLLAALRYIHNNPVKAKMCEMPEDYEWSSYREYLDKDTGLTDTAFIEMLASSYSDDWRDWLIMFTRSANNDSFIDFDNQPRLTDDMLKERAKELSGLSYEYSFDLLSDQKRDEIIRVLKAEGFAQKQIARVTSIPYGIIRRR